MMTKDASYFKNELSASRLSTIPDAATRRLINELIEYAAKVEEELEMAEDRPQKPRPDDTSESKKYREWISWDILPKGKNGTGETSVRSLVEELLSYTEEVENALLHK